MKKLTNTKQPSGNHGCSYFGSGIFLAGPAFLGRHVIPLENQIPSEPPAKVSACAYVVEIVHVDDVNNLGHILGSDLESSNLKF